MKYTKESVFLSDRINFRHALLAIVDAAQVYSRPRDGETIEQRESLAITAFNQLMAKNRATVTGSRGQRFKIQLHAGSFNTLRDNIKNDMDLPQVKAVSGYDGNLEADPQGAVHCHRMRAAKLCDNLTTKSWRKTKEESEKREASEALKRKLTQASKVQMQQSKGKKARRADMTPDTTDGSSSDISARTGRQTPASLRAEAKLVAAESDKLQALADEKAADTRKAEALSRERVELRRMDLEERKLLVMEKQQEADRAAAREARAAEQEERRADRAREQEERRASQAQQMEMMKAMLQMISDAKK